MPPYCLKLSFIEAEVGHSSIHLDAGADTRYASRRGAILPRPPCHLKQRLAASMLKSLYNWTLSLAESRYAPFALAIIAFAESSFFPIPPDAILVPMSLAKPKRAWLYAGICTVASVLGGVLGYVIGAYFYQTIGKWLIDLYGYGPKMDALRALYAQWGALLILVKGFTPIPFKLVTIISGLLDYPFIPFVLLSILTRGARFFALALLLNRFGDTIKDWLERYFGLFILLLGITIILGFWIATHLL